MNRSATVSPLPPAVPAVRREPRPASSLVTRLEQLGKTLRPTPHVPLAVEGMNLFAKLEYVNPVGSIKDRSAYWILRRAAERGEITEDTTVIESSSGNFATALATFTRLVGLKFIPVIDPKISGTYESFLRRTCPTVVKVEERDDTGGYLKTRLAMVKQLCATVPNAYWTNQYENPDAMDAHYRLTAGEICADFDAIDYVFIGVSTAGTISGVSRRLKERYPNIRVIAVDTKGSVIFGGPPGPRHIPGIGASIVPPLVSHAKIDDVVWIPEREAVDEFLDGRSRYAADADAALLGQDELAGGRGGVLGRQVGLALAHAASSAMAGANAGPGANPPGFTPDTFAFERLGHRRAHRIRASPYCDLIERDGQAARLYRFQCEGR